MPLPASTDPIIEAITPDHRHKSCVAAELRASAEVQRGFGNMQHVRSMQASAGSRKDIGEAVASKLHEQPEAQESNIWTPAGTSTQAAQTQDSSTQAAVLVPSITPTTRSMAFAHAVVLTQRRRDILRNSDLFPHLALATPVPVSDTLRCMFHRRFLNSVGIHSLEVGGNGDCLFHSAAAGVERLLLQSIAAS